MPQKIEIAARAFTPAFLVRSSLDQEARTIEIVFSTGAAVKRYSWDEGYYMEKLSMDPSAVDLGRLNAGASLLNTHHQSDMADRLGAVVPGSARVADGKGYCIVQISRNPEGERLMVDLRDGMALPISVGYRIHSYLKEEGSDDALPTYTATRWEPLEVSAVPVPADPGAHARVDAPTDRHTVPVTHRRAESGADRLESTIMSDNAETLERSRADKITEIAERFDAPMRLARKAISEGRSEGEFREMILDHRRKEQAKTEIFSVTPPHHADLSERGLVVRLADAMTLRLDRSHKAADDARAFVGLSVPELARRALEARGMGTAGMAPNQLVERALHSTSDFPLALATVGQRELAKAYSAAPSALKAIAKATTMRDFRPKANVILQGGGSLLRVNEHGEFKRTTFVEGAEQYGLSTFGRIFGVTRAALVNDDLGVFADLPARFGRMANEFEAGFLAKALEDNGKMGDGKAVFHADHGNLAATGSALSIASLSAGRLALRQQTDVAGDLIGTAPKFLVVPAALETSAEQLLATIAATKTSDVNPFASSLTLVVEPRLKDQQAWYLAGDPAQYPSLEFAHLEGQEEPRLDQRVGFDVDGVEYKVALDFGAAVTDFRGLFKNPGISL